MTLEEQVEALTKKVQEQAEIIDYLTKKLYGDQTVDVSTVRRWVVHFIGGNSTSGSLLLVQIYFFFFYEHRIYGIVHGW